MAKGKAELSKEIDREDNHGIDASEKFVYFLHNS